MPSKRQPTSEALEKLRAARLREVELRCEKLRRELALAAREAIPRSEVDRAITLIGKQMSMQLYYGVESELPVRLDGLGAAEIRPILAKWADALIDHMRNLEVELLPAKPATKHEN